jgi:hypothetical protein
MSEQEIVDRLAAAKAAQERTRFAFFTNTLIGLILGAVFWNGYFSIYQRFAFDHFLLDDRQHWEALKGYEVAEDGKKDEYHEEQAKRVKKLQDELMANWVSSRFTTVTLLGIKFGVGDAPVLGSIAVLISLVWFLMVVQRENLTIGALLHDAWNTKKDCIRWRVCHGIVAYTIFTHADDAAWPISEVKEKQVDAKDGQWQRRGIKLLHFFPILILVFGLVFDILVANAWVKSPFRLPHEEKFTFDRFWVYWLLALVLIVMDFLTWLKMIGYLSATEKVLIEYRKLVMSKHERC